MAALRRMYKQSILKKDAAGLYLYRRVILEVNHIQSIQAMFCNYGSLLGTQLYVLGIRANFA